MFKALVVYESMFGNTRRVAQAIASGLQGFATVSLVNVNAAGRALPGVDLLVVGGPTHAHGMTRKATRAEAERWANDPGKHLRLVPGAPGAGVREWLSTLKRAPGLVASFDTRAGIPEFLSRSAGAKIENELARRGPMKLRGHESFLLHGNGEISNTELLRARDWGTRLGTVLATARLTG